jgi:Protein of unknown function (DUF3631)
MADPIPFPGGEDAEHRFRQEVERLATQSPAERVFRLARMKSGSDPTPQRLGVAYEDLEEALKARVKELAHEARTQAGEDKIKAQIERRRESKEKSRAALFKRLRKMSEQERMLEIEQWCRIYDGESPERVAADFAEYIGPSKVETGADVTALWPDPVDGLQLVNQMQARLRRHIYMSEIGLTVCPIWALMTHVPLEITQHAPILTLFSIHPNAGKTTALYILAWMSRNAAIEVSASASVYQTMAEKVTLFVEEGQSIFENKKIQEIFDASWTQGGVVRRQFGGVRMPFDVFCHKAIGMLGRDVPPASSTRMIFIRMREKLDTEIREDFKHRDDAEFQEIRRKAARWVADHREELDAANPKMPEKFSNRLAQNYKMMFAIADLLGGDLPAKLRTAAERLAPPVDLNLSWHKQLLLDLRAYLRGKGHPDTVTSADLVRHLLADDDSPWHHYRGHKITKWELARLISKNYEIHPEHVGDKKSRTRGYKVEKFAEDFARTPKDPLRRTRAPNGIQVRQKVRGCASPRGVLVLNRKNLNRRRLRLRSPALRGSSPVATSSVVGIAWARAPRGSLSSMAAESPSPVRLQRALKLRLTRNNIR